MGLIDNLLGMRGPFVESRHPQGIMGTRCFLTVAAVDRKKAAQVKAALADAENALRSIESRMSCWFEKSELSVLNAARAGREIALSPETVDVLRAAREAAGQTDGAFDVTSRPIIELWKLAGKRHILPAESEIQAARRLSQWPMFELRPGGAMKHGDQACLDLGGIAKGYALDRVLAIMRESGADGGLVEIGGDLACFGRPPYARVWKIGIRDPFGGGQLGHIFLEHGGAVCTSGDYERYYEIGGRRYCHIIDPRTGSPADSFSSVTVLASTAMLADIWSTALSILGPGGFALLPAGVEAMLIGMTVGGTQIHKTHSFPSFFRNPGARAT